MENLIKDAAWGLMGIVAGLLAWIFNGIKTDVKRNTAKIQLLEVTHKEDLNKAYTETRAMFQQQEERREKARAATDERLLDIVVSIARIETHIKSLKPEN